MSFFNEEIDITQGSSLKSFLEDYIDENHECLQEHKNSLLKFLDIITDSIDQINYNRENILCILSWMCKQYQYYISLNESDKEDIMMYIDGKIDEDGELNKSLQKIIDNAPPLECDLIVFRGVKLENDGKNIQLSRVTSTSLNVTTSIEFTYFKEECCLMVIKLKRGDKCLIVFDEDNVVDESEIILSNETLLKKINGDKRIYYDVSLREGVRKYNGAYLNTSFWKT